MAGNMANPDMEILFGVSGGGDLNGESGKLILGQLNEIVSNINKNPLKIRFSLETDAQQQRQFQEQIKGLLGSVKTEGVKIDKLTLSESAIADFQRQLSKLGNNIRSGSDMEKISAETDKASKAVERLNISEEKQLRTLREAWRLLGNLENKVKGFSAASGGASNAAYQTIIKDAEQLRSALQNLDGQDIKFNGLLGNSGISDLRQLSGLLEGIRDRLSKSTTEIMRFGENSAQSYTKWNHILAETESKLAKLQALQAEASRTGSMQLVGQVQGDYDSLKNIQTEFLDGAKSIDELRVKLSEIDLASDILPPPMCATRP